MYLMHGKQKRQQYLVKQLYIQREQIFLVRLKILSTNTTVIIRLHQYRPCHPEIFDLFLNLSSLLQFVPVHTVREQSPITKICL
jgi:hypothetical protein